MKINKLKEDLSKNAQFSIHGQARAVYLAFLVGACAGAGVLMALLGSRILVLFGLFLVAQVRSDRACACARARVAHSASHPFARIRAGANVGAPRQAIFHLWEYTFNALFHPNKLSSNDFLLPWQHSNEFLYAFVAALSEFWLEAWLAPSLKMHTWLLVVALVVVASMQALRTAAMYTAASNFTHQIAEQKNESHVLVTHGVYAYLRHPSYCGWFWWAVGTQLLLANPLCTVGYALAAWRFFDDRIHYEEQTLVEYFGSDYIQYRCVWRLARNAHFDSHNKCALRSPLTASELVLAFHSSSETMLCFVVRSHAPLHP